MRFAANPMNSEIESYKMSLEGGVEKGLIKRVEVPHSRVKVMRCTTPMVLRILETGLLHGTARSCVPMYSSVTPRTSGSNASKR